MNIIDCFYLHFWFHFLCCFSRINWFTQEIYDLTLCLAQLFGQDHLLNLIILGVYTKRWPKCARISRQKLMQHKIWSIMFFLTLAARRPFHRKYFKFKKIKGYEATFWKNGSFTLQNLIKERKQPPVVIQQKSIFYKIFIRCLWLRTIRRSD